MKKNLQTLAMPAAIAATILVGCSTPPAITDRTDATRPSVVQVSENYDTFGRRWADQTPPPVPPPVAPAQPAPAPKPEMLTRNRSVIANYTGTITDIDYTDREMTLQDSQGRLETFAVSQNVRRFKEAKVGDKVSVDYYLGVTAEVRKPTAEEEQNPLVVLDTAGRARPEDPPAAGGLRHIRAVVTIEAMDRPNQTLTVKGPRGRHFVVHVVDPSRFEQVRIGETIVMNFTEAAAISLKPAAD